MLRFGLVLMAIVLTVGTVGCTQCDTCDDFPTPCVGPNCGGYQGAMVPPGTYTPSSPTSGVMGTTIPSPGAAAPPPGDAGTPGPAPSNEPAVVPPATGPGPDQTPPAPMTPASGSPFMPNP
jgi:hypothetical protein